MAKKAGKRRKTSWNMFFAKHRRQGKSPAAIGRLWRSGKKTGGKKAVSKKAVGKKAARKTTARKGRRKLTPWNKFVKEHAGSGKSLKQLARLYKGGASAAPKRRRNASTGKRRGKRGPAQTVYGRKVAGIRTLKAIIGGTTRNTYLTKSRRGKIRRISTPQLFGFKSGKALELAIAKGDKRGASLSKRLAALTARRGKYVAKLQGQLQSGRWTHPFVMNRRHRRRRYTANRRRRGFVANLFGTSTSQMLQVLKFGGGAIGGYAVHRLLTNLLDRNVLSQFVPQLGNFSNVVAGAVVAFAGVTFAPKFIPSMIPSAAVTGGMAASLLQSIVAAVAPNLLASASAQLSAYPDAGARASSLGSYFTLDRNQVYPSALHAGVGEYLSPSASNFVQGAAGFGSVPLMQAAAGVGDGIGEYEVVPGMSGMSGYGFGAMDEGIAPNLSSAEQALNVAEAAAGVGDLSMMSTVDPLAQAVPVPDEPAGSRSGTLAGRDGVFGA